MTPLTQPTPDYVTAYQRELAVGIEASRRPAAAIPKIRRTLGRWIVRLGARMLPETPDVIAGSIIVLPMPPPEHPERKAA